MEYRLFEVRLGTCGVVFEGEKAVRIFLPSSRTEVEGGIVSQYSGISENAAGASDLCGMIQRYFEGEDIFIPMDLVDTNQCTPFQLHVLKAERSIPRGKAATYSWVAKKAGTSGIRAAGNALAKNPFPIVVPCHRAVRANGEIGKYQGGPDMKRHLLMQEGVHFDDSGRVHADSLLK
jgi:methylated-DNA-[protein]-cysteine S-methyltransferase